jgi:hypothetical protein
MAQPLAGRSPWHIREPALILAPSCAAGMGEANLLGFDS